MTFDDLMRTVLAIFPNAQFDEDLDGQITIYTDLMEDGHGNVVPYVDSTDETEADEEEEGS